MSRATQILDLTKSLIEIEGVNEGDDSSKENQANDDADSFLPPVVSANNQKDSDIDDWHLSECSQLYAHKKHSNLLRIPVELFRTLYPHQRQGIVWMTDRFKDGTGGILAE